MLSHKKNNAFIEYVQKNQLAIKLIYYFSQISMLGIDDTEKLQEKFAKVGASLIAGKNRRYESTLKKLLLETISKSIDPVPLIKKFVEADTRECLSTYAVSLEKIYNLILSFREARGGNFNDLLVKNITQFVKMAQAKNHRDKNKDYKKLKREIGEAEKIKLISTEHIMTDPHPSWQSLNAWANARDKEKLNEIYSKKTVNSAFNFAVLLVVVYPMIRLANSSNNQINDYQNILSFMVDNFLILSFVPLLILLKKIYNDSKLINHLDEIYKFQKKSENAVTGALELDISRIEGAMAHEDEYVNPQASDYVLQIFSREKIPLQTIEKPVNDDPEPEKSNRLPKHKQSKMEIVKRQPNKSQPTASKDKPKDVIPPFKNARGKIFPLANLSANGKITFYGYYDKPAIDASVKAPFTKIQHKQFKSQLEKEVLVGPKENGASYNPKKNVIKIRISNSDHSIWPRVAEKQGESILLAFEVARKHKNLKKYYNNK